MSDYDCLLRKKCGEELNSFEELLLYPTGFVCVVYLDR